MRRLTSYHPWPSLLFSIILIFTFPNCSFAATQTFELSQLCKGQFSTQMRREIDGAVIISRNEKNLDCSVTFIAEYVTQKFLIRFEEFQMECGDQLNIYDSSSPVGNARAELNCRYLRAEDVGIIRTRGHTVTLKFIADNWGTSPRRFKMIITAYKDTSQGCRDSFFCSADNTCISNRLLCDNVYNCGDGMDESRAANCSSNVLLDLISSMGGGDSSMGILIISGLVVISTVIVLLLVCLCQKKRSNPSPPTPSQPTNNHYSKTFDELDGGRNGRESMSMIGVSGKSSLVHSSHHPHQSSTLESLKSGNLRLPADSHGDISPSQKEEWFV